MSESAKSITIAQSAADQLRKVLTEQNRPGAGLRIAVRGGGCSGLTYAMDLADEPSPKDRVFERDGVRVFVDTKSLLYLGGSELVYEQSFMTSTFKLVNPNVKATCGCGESFAV